MSRALRFDEARDTAALASALLSGHASGCSLDGDDLTLQLVALGVVFF